MIPRTLLLACLLLLGLCLELNAAPASASLIGKSRPWTAAEFKIDGIPAVENPFDPAQISVIGTLVAPSGNTLEIPAFWYADFERSLEEGVEKLHQRGPPEWRLRFTPTESGRHRLALKVTLAGKDAQTAAPLPFTVDAVASSSDTPGWVRIAADKQSFETSNGQALRLIGHNVCWADARGTADYDLWFEAMAQAGENFARLWLSPWFIGLEHEPGTLNRYPLGDVWQLDYIFKLAEKHRIYLLLCFDHHGMYQTTNKSWGGSNNFWKVNPYSELNGGPCAKPNDFFSNARAREIYKKRLNYLVARYAHSPRLLSWQFFNEIDNVYGPLVPEDVTAWHREMGAWFKARDPYKHLVTTSLTSESDRPEIWSLPEMDFSMYHSYNAHSPVTLFGHISRSFSQRYGKPVMIGEFGTNSAAWHIANDPHLRGFRQGQWASALGGSVGTAMAWWWQDMHTDRVYPLFRSMRTLLDDAGWSQGSWEPADIAAETTAVPLGASDEPFNASLALNVSRYARLSGEVSVCNPPCAERSGRFLSSYLRGSREPELRKAMRLQVLSGKASKFTVRVNSVAGDTELSVRVDGVEQSRTRLADLDGMAVVNKEHNKELSLELPPGRHVLELSNEGADWIFIDALRFERLLPFAGGVSERQVPEAVALRQGGKLIAYVNSPELAFPAGALRYNPGVRRGDTLSLPSWPEGEFEARYFDPRTGSLLSSRKIRGNGKALSIELPEYSEDLVVVLRPSS